MTHEYDTVTSTCTTTPITKGNYGPVTLTKGAAYTGGLAGAAGYKLVISDVSKKTSIDFCATVTHAGGYPYTVPALKF